MHTHAMTGAVELRPEIINPNQQPEDEVFVLDLCAAAHDEPDRSLTNLLVASLADEVVRRLKPELAKMTPTTVQPALLDVKQAGVYLGRTEQAIQHLMFDRQLPVVRVGRRVHLDRKDLDLWIEKNKY